MTDAMEGFWWGDSEVQKRMHWMAWWKMCIPKKNGGMGFRDLHAFNLAMLAKQCWRLITNPDTLCARVLRAKYYPHGDLLKVGPKSGSSFTWQSIIAGLSTFKRGLIWRVGSGRRINIWEDCWIPDSPSRKVITRKGNILLRSVDELIDQDTGLWDVDLMQAILNPVDVSRIQRIPLSLHLQEDFVAWHFTKNHVFSVRSAYYAEWNHLNGRKLSRADEQGTSICNPVWEILWKLQVPSKVKFFFWRALLGDRKSVV